MKESLKNILKLPILWAAMIAIGLNLWHYHPSVVIENSLMMGAYASMTMQLFLLGIYLYGVKFKTINRVLLGWVSALKFIVLPLIAYSILSYLEMNTMIKGLLMMELIMPLAVANVNLASLYDCRPKELTALVFITSIAFLGIIALSGELLLNI